MADLPKFVVPRSTWWRGHGPDGSKLLRGSDGMRCCLGHVGQQCGMSDEQLRNITDPGACGVHRMWPTLLIDYKKVDSISIVCMEMMQTNDSDRYSEVDRESRLQALAIQAGFILEFVE